MQEKSMEEVVRLTPETLVEVFDDDQLTERWYMPVEMGERERLRAITAEVVQQITDNLLALGSDGLTSAIVQGEINNLLDGEDPENAIALYTLKHLRQNDFFTES
jgi:hypothetical protein